MSRPAEMHCMANNLDGPPMERIVREMHAMVVEQRQRQQQYEMVSHQLMAELRQQRVPAADAAALANLSAELERSLARVAELEAHNHMHASESRGGFGANSSNGGYPGGTPGAGARLGAAEDLHSMDGSSGRRARGRCKWASEARAAIQRLGTLLKLYRDDWPFAGMCKAFARTFVSQLVRDANARLGKNTGHRRIGCRIFCTVPRICTPLGAFGITSSGMLSLWSLVDMKQVYCVLVTVSNGGYSNHWGGQWKRPVRGRCRPRLAAFAQ
eukprot:2037639-Pleurochrysis_carterae.AAC.3